MTSQQFKNLFKQHNEVIKAELDNFNYFMNLITEDLINNETSKENRDLYDSVFDELFEARESIKRAYLKTEIAKETLNNER